eukprot:CAMPEP_0183342280 /NCGR_PEP_ID=MMETSP0164_2-20130417/8406_1 /TAXON_ID=221442 /ORGANISM="Coccolithus pelagicus ssp braarudi, Strain PLY182g" /LENGTH=281 /DNA_ID=CAMNT_0025512809 /DNA_START=56 /DNA_END=901 /DNA_ORIENTATION=-
MTEHLRCDDVACPLLSSHDDLFIAALGIDAAEISDLTDDSDLPDTQQIMSPYLAIEALSIGASQRLPSLTDQELIAFEDCLATVTDDLGKCESFLRTPIPLGYTRYTERFLFLWLTTLPLALTRTFCGFQAGTWWEGKLDEPWPLVVFTVGFISVIFLSIEDIAVQQEEPFAVLPLEFHHTWLLQDMEMTRRLKRRLSRSQMASSSSSSSAPSSLSHRAPRSRSGATLTEQLTELNELRDAGLLTEYEYYRKRMDVLDLPGGSSVRGAGLPVRGGPERLCG